MLQENNINLSIVIPVYNEDKYLPKLFDELILYFNLKNVEVIIVDDGSTDKSTDIINKFIKRKDYKFNIKTIKLDINSGKGKALQTGINVAKANVALSAAEEAIKASSDPVYRDPLTSGLNIGTSGIAGFTLGSLVGLVKSGKAPQVIK